MRRHDDAVDAVLATAAAVPASLWDMPRAEGKWSAAGIVEHLSVVYDVLIAELAGAPGLKIRLPVIRRTFYRATLLPLILSGRWFPQGVPSPREVRPATEAPIPRQITVQRFQDRVASFRTTISSTRATTPRKRVTHSYLGTLDLEQALRFVAAHHRHHTRQLAQVVPRRKELLAKR